MKLRYAIIATAIAAAIVTVVFFTYQPKIDSQPDGSQGVVSPTVQVPINVNLTLLKHDLSIGDTVPLTFSFTPLRNVSDVKVNLDSSGIIEVKGEKQFSFGNVSANEKRTIEFDMLIQDAGHGEMIAQVTVTQTDLNFTYSSSDRLYFIASNEEVLVGSNGFSTLEIEQLDKKLASGAITKEEYDREMERILGGGAIENNG